MATYLAFLDSVVSQPPAGKEVDVTFKLLGVCPLVLIAVQKDTTKFRMFPSPHPPSKKKSIKRVTLTLTDTN